MSPRTTRCIAFRHHELAGVWAGLSEDILRYLNKSPENRAAGDRFKTRVGAFLTPQLLCLLLYRIAHWLWVIEWHNLATNIGRLNCVIHKVSIAPQSCIGPGCLLPHPVGVTFCATAGQGLTLYAMAVCCPQPTDPACDVELGPMLGDRVSVGAQTAIVGPVVVGDDTKVAFHIGLERDAPAGVLVLSDLTRVRISKD
jgi:serine O-acetyltransferase